MDQNNKNQLSINWYPGHMKKSIEIISNKISSIDFYIEVLDARAITYSSNSELNKVFNNKPKIIIALKSDLAQIDPNQDNNIVIGNIYDKSFRNKIINKINQVCASKIESLKKKGLVTIQLVGIIVGLPNIGKSSLINFLANKKLVIAQNKPGVTKKVNYIKIDKNLVLFDTPGIFFKKVEKFEVGAILTIIKSVNFDVVNKYEVLKYIFDYMNHYYKQQMQNHFEYSNIEDFDLFIEHICNLKKFKLPNNENDFERCYYFLYTEFSESKICLVNYEK